MARIAIIFALLLTVSAVGRTAEPEFNGKKLGEWDTMLRESANPRLRKVALVSMGQIASDNTGDAKLVKEILTAVGRTLKTDSAPSVRKQAAEVIGSMAVKLLEDIKNSDIGSVLVDLNENLRVEKESDVRKEVAIALGRFGKEAKSAVTSLTALLMDPDQATRAAAVDTLGRIGAGAGNTADAILPLLKDKEQNVRAAAIFALGRIEPEEPSKIAGALLPLVTGEPVVELRRAVLTSLGLLGDRSPATVKGTALGLKDADVEVRRQAAQAIGKYVGGGKLVEAELKLALETDKDKQVRGAALRALCEGFGPDAKILIPTIVARLKVETEFDVRIAIIEELGAMGEAGKEALPALREAQRDPQTKVREAAAGAIKRISAIKPKM